MDIAAWLRELGLERHEQAFRDNDIDAKVLPHLTAEDLKDIGITSVGHRRTILAAIEALRQESPSLEPEAATPAPALPEPAATPPEAERRQLTVLFCDLVGSTELSARVDPEDLRDVMRTYQDACAAVLKRWDGHVAKYLGDGVLAYFGWPLAHEDDAERAVRAGLELVAVVGQLTADGSALATRIGIATGQVVVGDLIGEGAAVEEAVVGDTPNLAARLQTMAEPGTVVIAPSTRLLLGGLFELNDLGPQNLKGFPEPLSAWRVVAESGAESRFEALRGGRVMPLVGREHEIGLLVDRWERAKEGEGQVVLLSGEPGIGKSRIVRALREGLAGEHLMPLSHYCSPYYTNSALYPVIGLLERGAGFARDDAAEARLDKLEALLARGTATLGEAVPLVAALLEIESGERYPPLALSSQRQKQRTLEVLVDQVEGLAAEQPVLAIYEDVHWVDPTTLDVLGLLVERVQHLPVLVLITFRPEFDPPWTGHAHVMQLSLSRLTRRHGQALVDEVTGGKAVPSEVLDQILAKTDGVPLFVEELTKTVLESGLLTDVSDHYALAGPVAQLAIPTTLQDSLMARLDHLGSVKEVAQIGAAIGREFSHGLLAAVAPLDQVGLQAALDQLIASELVFRRGTPPDAIYSFKHALVQDAAYGTLLRSRRRPLHALIAHALEEHFPNTAHTRPELLAHHCTRAGLHEAAVLYWRQAGQLAAQRSAYSEAAAHLRSALELVLYLPDEAERCATELDIQAALGEVSIAVSGYSASETGEAFARARELCQGTGDTSQMFRVLFGQFRFHIARAEYALTYEIAEDFLSIANRSTDIAPKLFGHRCLGISCFYLADFAMGRSQLEQAHGLRDAEQQDLLATRYGIDPQIGTLRSPLPMLPMILYILGYPNQAVVTAAKERGGVMEESQPYALSHALYHAAWFDQLRRVRRGARDHTQKLSSLAEEQGFSFWLGPAAILHGWAVAEGELVREGMAEIERGLTMFRTTTGAEMCVPYYLSLLAEVRGKVGQLSDGLNSLAEAMATVERTGERWIEPELYRLKGELLHSFDSQHDSVSEAEISFQKAIDIAREHSAKMWELRAATGLGRLWAAQGRRADAHDLLAPIYDWFTEGFDTADLKDAKALVDELR